MANVKHILRQLFDWAPSVLAWEKDNIGLLIGSKTAEVTGIAITLDVTEQTVEEAIRLSANLIVSHHPLIFHPLKSIRTDDKQGALLSLLLKNDIAVIAMHTNADASQNGLNVALARKLGLQEIRSLEPVRGSLRALRFHYRSDAEARTSCIEFLSGEEELDWSLLPGMDGEELIEIHAPEWRERELITELTKRFGADLISTHVSATTDLLERHGMGVIGNLAEPVPFSEFLTLTKKEISPSVLRATRVADESRVLTVAICTGAGGSMIHAAHKSGADVFLTGECTYHHFVDAPVGMILVDVGHFESEKIFIPLCFEELSKRLFAETEKIDIFPLMNCENPITYIT
jgi:dinuclear metal center YbgI/SA1388 family protein